MGVRKQPQIHESYWKCSFLNTYVQNFNSKSGCISAYLVFYCKRPTNLLTKLFTSSKRSGMHVYFKWQEIIWKAIV